MGKKKAQARSTDTRERILKEAEALFAAKGYDSTGIDEIARNAGITKSVIYYHFESKNDILQSLFQEYFQQGIEFKKQYAPRTLYDRSVSIMDAMSGYLKFAEGREHVARIVLMESVKNTDRVPLFDFWEKNALITSEMFPDKIKNLTREDIMFKSFLMIYMPLLGYLIFRERWCEHFKLSRERTRELCAEAVSEYYEAILKDLVIKQ
jgi:AcrR family transcriptional regulator